MQTLIFIHGGESFRNEAQYQDWLKEEYVNRILDPWQAPKSEKSWKEHLAEQFIKKGDVYMLQMPNKSNAKYKEWKLVFEGFMKKKLAFYESITLIGNSLGGCFLLKYFSEKSTSFPYEALKAIHLIAPCLEAGDFSRPENFDFLRRFYNTHLWHAEDDMIVPIEIGREIAESIPNMKTHFFPASKGYGHFSRDKEISIFPELESLIIPKGE